MFKKNKADFEKGFLFFGSTFKMAISIPKWEYQKISIPDESQQ